MTSELPAYPATRPPSCPFDPPPEYREWREQPGLRRATWNGCPVWVASRHDDVEAALTDPRLSAEVRGPLLAATLDGVDEMPPVFPRMDEPEHGRIRRMLVKDFTAKRARDMRAQVTTMADAFLDRIVKKGPPADLVRDYALPLPSLVISLLLGVPYDDHAFFQEHSSTAFRLDATPEEHLEAAAALFGYMLDLVERKRHDPGDDLMSRLATEQTLTPTEAAMTGMILLNAGHETTSNMIALSLALLLTDRGVLEPTTPIGPAVEELLRYLSIVQGFVIRVAREDLSLGGEQILAGEAVLMNLPAGNRDPDRFDHPDTLLLDRDARRHLAFGYGSHVCIGQSLARVELEVAIPLALRRLPGLRLAVPLEEIPFRDRMGTYGVHELPVVWDL